jgi:hypothetical protein
LRSRSAPSAPKATPKATAGPRKPDAEDKHGGSYDLAIASFYDRREAKLREDREGLAVARQERAQIANFARSRGMAPEDVHAMLAVVHEHEALPRGKEAVEKRLAQTMESLRIECGGAAQATALCESYTKFASALAKEIPSLVSRAETNGAGGHPDLIRIGAKYAEPVVFPTEHKE